MGAAAVVGQSPTTTFSDLVYIAKKNTFKLQVAML